MLIKNGLVIDPKNNIEEMKDIRIEEGKVVEVSEKLEGFRG